MSEPLPLVEIDKFGVPAEPLLRKVLERWEADATFRDDLDACNFQPYPSPSDDIDCLNPWMFVIAMNGGGSAYGLYLHPSAVADSIAPWVFWEHEDDTIRYLASGTDRFFRGLVAFTESWTEEPDRVARVRATLAVLGAQMDAAPVTFDFDGAPGADWLPPVEAAVKDVAVYLELLTTDPDTAERGLLAHRMQQDPDAIDALDSLYEARGWKPPMTQYRDT